MFKPKTTISGRLENSSGEWIRTTDLRVMSLNPGVGLFDRPFSRFSLARQTSVPSGPQDFGHTVVGATLANNRFFVKRENAVGWLFYSWAKGNALTCGANGSRVSPGWTTHPAPALDPKAA